MIVALYTLFELIATLVCLFSMYGKNFKLSVKSVAFISVDILCITIINIFGFSEIYTLIFVPLLISYCIWEFKFNLKKLIVNNILCFLLMIGFQVIGFIFYSIFFSFVKSDQLSCLIINIIVCIISIFVTKKVAFNKITKYLEHNDMEIVFSIAICYTVIALNFVRYKVSTEVSLAEYVIIIVVTGYIFIITAIVKKYKRAAKDKADELKIQSEYLNTYESIISDIKSRQHDFDNHINALRCQHYANEDKEDFIENQKKYLEEVASENEFNKVLISGNPILVSFLYSKFNEAKKKDIQIKYKLDFGELKSSVPITKLVELIGNLLDNAIDATVEMDYRIINVCVQENAEDINISISNTSKVIPISVVSELFSKGKSTKGGDRGYGLYNVKRICDDYDVEISYYNDFVDEQNYMVFELKIHKNCGN